MKKQAIFYFLLLSNLIVKAQSETSSLNSANGKYKDLIQTVYCPADANGYGDYQDYGYYGGGNWCNQDTEAGYWVWVNPNWYIWKNIVSGNSAPIANQINPDKQAYQDVQIDEAPFPVFIDDFWKDIVIDVKGMASDDKKYDYDQLIVAQSGLILLSDNYYGPHTYSLDNGKSWKRGKSRWSFRVPYFRDSSIMTQSSLDKTYYSTSNFTDYQTHKPEYTQEYLKVSRLHNVIQYKEKYYFVDNFQLKEIRNFEVLLDMTNDHFAKKNTSNVPIIDGVTKGSDYRIIHHLDDNSVSFDYEPGYYAINGKDVIRIGKDNQNPSNNKFISRWTYVKDILECDNKYFILGDSGHGYMQGEDISNFKIVPDYIADEKTGVLFEIKSYEKTGCPYITMSYSKINGQSHIFFKKISSNEWFYTTSVVKDLSYNPKNGRMYALKVTDDGSSYKLVESTRQFRCDCSEELFEKDGKENVSLKIKFYAYPKNTEVVKPDGSIVTSRFGHIYVGFFENNKLKIVKGFGPDGNSYWEASNLSEQNHLVRFATQTFEVSVSQSSYDAAINITKNRYFFAVNDCVTYADDVADEIGINSPSFTDLVVKPIEFIKYLKNHN